MSSVTPDSTTAALAANVPLEKKDEELPGAFPETPATELDKAGEFKVNPLPAAPGALNPITLAPGEKIPEGLAAESTTSQVKLDPESYEKSDTLPGDAPVILSSAAPESTTAALAASAPIETKVEVPEVVKESQEKAHFEPEASGVPEEVREKAAVETELLQKVKEAPSTSEGTAGEGTEKTEKAVTPGEAAASVIAAVTAVGGAALAGAVAAKDLAVEKATEAATTAQASTVEAAASLPESVKEQLPESVQEAIGGTVKEETREEVSPEVPTEVKESIAAAGKAPEAAANTEAVEEKKAVEAELLNEVKPVEADNEASKSKTTELKDKLTEATGATGEPSAIQIPPAADSTATNGASEPAKVVEAEPKPIEVKPTQSASGTPSDAVASDLSTKATNGASPTEKKKKNRLSAMLGKVRSKLTGNKS